MKPLFIHRASCAAVAAAVFLLLLILGCRPPAGPAPGTPSEPTAKPVPAIAEGPPALPDKFVLQPTIHTERMTYSAGTAFGVKHPDLARPVILTCLHIFGPGGGYPKDIPPLELSSVVKAVSASGGRRGRGGCIGGRAWPGPRPHAASRSRGSWSAGGCAPASSVASRRPAAGPRAAGGGRSWPCSARCPMRRWRPGPAARSARSGKSGSGSASRRPGTAASGRGTLGVRPGRPP
jgi:hypothetical protein